MASGADWRLIVISKQTHVGNLPGGHEVYRIDRIAALTLSSSESPEFDLDVSTTAYKFFKYLRFLYCSTCIFREIAGHYFYSFIYSFNP